MYIQRSFLCIFMTLCQILTGYVHGQEVKQAAASAIINTIISKAAVQPSHDSTVGALAGKVMPECIFGVETISFILFTKDIPKGQAVTIEEELPLTPGAKIRFLIHGFISEANTTKYFELAQKWVQKENVNILSVEWKSGACSLGGLSLAQPLTYPWAYENTRAVGNLVARFMKRLMEYYGAKLEETIIVGHSLGAHISGFAGKKVQELGYGQFQQIIGLDPAGPGFEGKKCQNRLCETDAKFVQAYHTSWMLGIHQPVAINDYYFNGGTTQPGCTALPTCSHTQAVVYLISLIEHSDCFLGVPWNRETNAKTDAGICEEQTCSVPGFTAPERKARGVFYIDVKVDEPFCKLESIKMQPKWDVVYNESSRIGRVVKGAVSGIGGHIMNFHMMHPSSLWN